MSPSHDFVIVGGGPAGLSAAITATRNGFSALVLEQGDRLGPRPRGEGVHAYPLFDELLGKGFLREHAYRTTHGSVYHSPGARQLTSLPTHSPLYFFEWREFIDRLGAVAAVGGATLRTGAQVTGVVEDGGRCRGVRYVDDAGEHTAEGTTVLGCDGYQSVLGRHYGVDYDQLSCPIIKCRIAQASFDPEQTRALQFYLIGNGDLSYAPRFPPAVAYAFPLADQHMEMGLMLRMGRGRSMPTVDRPREEALVEVWSQIKQSYPGFCRYFDGAVIEHEEPTDIPNASLWRENVPQPGVVLLGDSVGFVDPFGSSGIYSSMVMARMWTDRISRTMRAPGIGDRPDRVWTRRHLAAWRRAYRTSGAYRHVRQRYLQVGALEWYVFRHLRTAERINRRWSVISRLLKLG